MFSGKIEERYIRLNTRDGTRVNLKKVGYQSQKFADFETFLCLRRDNEKNIVAISVEVKSPMDIKLGVSVHLKYDKTQDQFPEERDLFFSATSYFLVFSQVATEHKMMAFYAPMNSYDDQHDYYSEFDARVKVFWTPHSLIYPTVIDKRVTVCIGDEEMVVDCKALTAHSEFFSGYFSSNLKEGQEGKYPITDCAMFDFAQLLAVIHPCGKSIDNENVATLLELAALYMMPTVTHRCECFLVERMNRKEAMVVNLELADKFGLEFANELLLATFGDGDKFRELMRDEKFEGLSEHLKNKIRLKYIEVDMQNNPVDGKYNYDDL